MNFYEFLQKKAIEDGIERFVVGAIITNEKGEIFLAKRKKDDFMGDIYEIPSGNSKKGESIYDTLIREIKEETNLDTKRVISYIDQFDYLSGSCKKCRQFNFKVEVTGGPILLTEHDSYKWIELKDIDKENEISPELKYGLLVYKFNEEQKKN
ncbi:MAG: NUDIX domain-containing protein [Clostridia bacterium]|nr:NUDIX domain-containing protein [Clostridia bacterium]